MDMDKYISHTGECVKILHFPGLTKEKNKDIMTMTSKYPVIGLPENVQIVTCVDELNVDTACLIGQLNKSNIEFINAANGVDVQPWVNTKKIKCYYDTLCKISKEYTMLLDGTDVTIVGDLSDVIEKFKTYNVDILYNATASSYPNVKIEEVEHRDFYGKYPNFNAGCCIGKTSELIKFYKEGMDILSNVEEDNQYKNSEQYHLRKVFANHMDTVWFDYRCKIFQVMHNVNTRCFEEARYDITENKIFNLG